MAEIIGPDLLARVRETISGKYWYTPGDGKAFDWQESTKTLAQSLNINGPDLVRNAIQSAFTPEALTRGIDGTLIEGLLGLSDRYSAHLTIWTVGDLKWQKIKAENTGLLDLAGSDRFKCEEVDKIVCVPKLLFGYPGGLIVDDKEKNVKQVRNLGLSIPLMDYVLKLGDERANPQAFLAWLENQLESGRICAGSRWLIDMDGVLIDTNKVLFGPAAENIARLI